MRFLMRRCGWILIVAAVLVAGCGEDLGPICDSCPPIPPTQTSPENVVESLQRSYRFREIEQYARLLAPEFIFKLQPGDVLELGTEFYTRDEDSSGTYALFKTREVADIKISLIYGAPEPANDVNLPPDAVHIRINQTQLQVDETAGISWVVTDLQDMFFRPGREENGEDPATWYLLEWRDIPTTLPPRIHPGQGTTWGKLKAKYTSS